MFYIVILLTFSISEVEDLSTSASSAIVSRSSSRSPSSHLLFLFTLSLLPLLPPPHCPSFRYSLPPRSTSPSPCFFLLLPPPPSSISGWSSFSLLFSNFVSSSSSSSFHFSTIPLFSFPALFTYSSCFPYSQFSQLYTLPFSLYLQHQLFLS